MTEPKQLAAPPSLDRFIVAGLGGLALYSRADA